MSAPSPSLQGKIAVVVGGTSGIGRAISLGLADAGAAVIASGRNKDKVDAVAIELESRKSRTLRATCDIASRASLEDLLQQVLQRFGTVDILVNCAAKIRRASNLCSAVNEDVDCAKALQHLLKQIFQGGATGNIAGRAQCAGLSRFEFDGDGVDFVFVSSRSDHCSARIGKTERYGASDAGRAAEYHRYFALQID